MLQVLRLSVCILCTTISNPDDLADVDVEWVEPRDRLKGKRVEG